MPFDILGHGVFPDVPRNNNQPKVWNSTNYPIACKRTKQYVSYWYGYKSIHASHKAYENRYACMSNCSVQEEQRIRFFKRTYRRKGVILLYEPKKTRVANCVFHEQIKIKQRHADYCLKRRINIRTVKNQNTCWRMASLKNNILSRSSFGYLHHVEVLSTIKVHEVLQRPLRCFYTRKTV